jgi:hypothetical protein
MQSENQVVWQETSMLQNKYAVQQQTINKILGFLASVFSKKKTVNHHKKRKLLLEDASETEDDDPTAVIQSLGELIADRQRQSSNGQGVTNYTTTISNLPASNCANLQGLNILPGSNPLLTNMAVQDSINSLQANNNILTSNLETLQSFSTSNMQSTPTLLSPTTSTPYITTETTADMPGLTTLNSPFAFPGGIDPTIPISEDMELLKDRLDSLSYLMNTYTTQPTQWSPNDLENANLSILQDTEEGKNLLRSMRGHLPGDSSSPKGTDGLRDIEEPEVTQDDFDKFFNDDE